MPPKEPTADEFKDKINSEIHLILNKRHNRLKERLDALEKLANNNNSQIGSIKGADDMFDKYVKKELSELRDRTHEKDCSIISNISANHLDIQQNRDVVRSLCSTLNIDYDVLLQAIGMPNSEKEGLIVSETPSELLSSLQDAQTPHGFIKRNECDGCGNFSEEAQVCFFSICQLDIEKGAPKKFQGNVPSVGRPTLAVLPDPNFKEQTEAPQLLDGAPVKGLSDKEIDERWGILDKEPKEAALTNAWNNGHKQGIIMQKSIVAQKLRGFIDYFHLRLPNEQTNLGNTIIDFIKELEENKE